MLISLIDKHFNDGRSFRVILNSLNSQSEALNSKYGSKASSSYEAWAILERRSNCSK